MTRKEIEQAEQRLVKINNIKNSGQLISIPNSDKKGNSGQYERYKALRKLALEVGGSFISKERQKTANEGELTEGIHRALQTAAMIDACRTAARNFLIAIVAAIIALLIALAAWAAIIVNVLIAVLSR